MFSFLSLYRLDSVLVSGNEPSMIFRLQQKRISDANFLRSVPISIFIPSGFLNYTKLSREVEFSRDYRAFGHSRVPVLPGNFTSNSDANDPAMKVTVCGVSICLANRKHRNDSTETSISNVPVDNLKHFPPPFLELSLLKIRLYDGFLVRRQPGWHYMLALTFQSRQLLARPSSAVELILPTGFKKARQFSSLLTLSPFVDFVRVFALERRVARRGSEFTFVSAIFFSSALRLPSFPFICFPF